MSDAESLMEQFKQQRELKVAERKSRFEAAPRPPTVHSLCLEHTLYTPVQLNPDRDERYLASLKFEAHQFDAYCVHCEQTTPFRTMADRKPGDVAQVAALAEFNKPAIEQLRRLVFEGGQFALHLGCTRRPQHCYSYFFHYDAGEGLLQKVGQMPSVEDIAGADIERYRSVLGADFGELRRATGLFAHGIGIGAFVYLRRIFENLVERARVLADPGDERKTDFLAMRMSDRVKALSDYLPPTVVKYKEAYSILSTGLHELSEAECKKYFPIVRAAIIAMLEQRYEAEQKAKAAADLDKAMAAIASEARGL